MCPLLASWAQFGSAARGLGTVWKFCVGWAQFGSARFSRAAHNLDAPTFSRAGHNLEVLRKLGTVWKCSSRVGLNLEVLRGFGTIWNCRVPGRLTCEKRALLNCTRPGSCTSKLCPTREKRALPNWAGLAEFRTSAWVEHNLEVQRSAARGLGTIWKCCVSWAQFGSAAHGLGTVWKCRVGWAQVGSAGFSRGLGTI